MSRFTGGDPPTYRTQRYVLGSTCSLAVSEMMVIPINHSEVDNKMRGLAHAHFFRASIAVLSLLSPSPSPVETSLLALPTRREDYVGNHYRLVCGAQAPLRGRVCRINVHDIRPCYHTGARGESQIRRSTVTTQGLAGRPFLVRSVELVQSVVSICEATHWAMWCPLVNNFMLQQIRYLALAAVG